MHPWTCAGLLTIGLVGCYRASPVGSLMWQHYDRADDLQEQVRLGSLDGARGSARWLADHGAIEGLPAGSAHYDVDLRILARRVADTPSVATAASAIGQIGATCGACHQAYDVGPRFSKIGSAPEISSFAADQMTRHGWAADRMWDGLVGPSDESWNAGALALSRAPLYQRFLTNRWDIYQELRQLAEHVEQLGKRAVDTKEHRLRAEVFGEFLGTCATCHDLVGRRD